MGSPACPDLVILATTTFLRVDVTTSVFQRRKLRL